MRGKRFISAIVLAGIVAVQFAAVFFFSIEQTKASGDFTLR
jgi:hypothetical protein